MFDDNHRDNLNDNAAIYTELNEESVFTVDEELLTLMGSIVEEHECTGKACNRVTENNCSGIEPHDRHPAVLNEFMTHPNCRKTLKD